MPLSSMTGFGQFVHEGKVARVSVELRTVNHRFAEFHVRVPREWLLLEEDVRSRLSKQISRGRVDAYVTIEPFAPAEQPVAVNWSLLDALCNAEREALQRQGHHSTPSVPSVAHWLNYPDVIQVVRSKLDEEAVRTDVAAAVEQACRALVDMRVREGLRLGEDIQDKLTDLEQQVSIISEQAPQALETARNRLRVRLSELGSAVEDSRWLTEITIMAERMAIDEELVRLRSHTQEFRSSLANGSPIGRRLDFIVQEMNREVNTVASKSADVQISKAVVAAKAIVEQLREQVQNIE